MAAQHLDIMTENVLRMEAAAAGPPADPNDPDSTVYQSPTPLVSQTQHTGAITAPWNRRWISIDRDDTKNEIQARVGTIDKNRQLVVGYGLASITYLSDTNGHVVETHLPNTPTATA